MALPLRKQLPQVQRDCLPDRQSNSSPCQIDDSSVQSARSKLRVVSPEDIAEKQGFAGDSAEARNTAGKEFMNNESTREPSQNNDRRAGGAELLDGSAAATPPLYPTEDVLEELQAASQLLEAATPQDILRWSVERYASRFTMATAFGPEGMCLIHMLAEIAPDTPLFNLETGYQFAETLALREQVKQRYGIEVEYKYPETTVEQYEAMHGGPLYKSEPNQCCADRKLTVLRKAARGFHAWGSAIRRDQSPDRAKAAIVGWDKKFHLVKVSPLANWTKKDVWSFISKHEIPYNPLHDQGFPSIGCWPCTRRIMDGEDERAGRWSGFAKTECGLHSS